MQMPIYLIFHKACNFNFSRFICLKRCSGNLSVVQLLGPGDILGQYFFYMRKCPSYASQMYKSLMPVMWGYIGKAWIYDSGHGKNCVGLKIATGGEVFEAGVCSSPAAATATVLNLKAGTWNSKAPWVLWQLSRVAPFTHDPPFIIDTSFLTRP